MKPKNIDRIRTLTVIAIIVCLATYITIIALVPSTPAVRQFEKYFSIAIWGALVIYSGWFALSRLPNHNKIGDSEKPVSDQEWDTTRRYRFQENSKR